MLIVGTYRSDDLTISGTRSPGCSRHCGASVAWSPGGAPATREQIGGLMRAFALAEPGVSITSDFRDAIFARSDGNRFFAGLLRSLCGVRRDLLRPRATGWGRKPLNEARHPGLDPRHHPRAPGGGAPRTRPGRRSPPRRSWGYARIGFEAPAGPSPRRTRSRSRDSCSNASTSSSSSKGRRRAQKGVYGFRPRAHP